MLYRHLLMDDFSYLHITSVMTSHRILIRADNLNAHFFSVFLFVYALQVSKALSVKGVILCKFS